MTVSRDANSLIVQFLDWQTENLQARDSEEGRVFLKTPFKTPFARADGHAFEIEGCFLQDGSVRFTDAGETVDELWMQGIDLNDATLEYIIRIAHRFRVNLSEGDNVLANDGDGGARQLQDLISAILAISALIEHPREADPARLTRIDSAGTTRP